MGWWGYDILDGDEPLDHLCYLAEICGVTWKEGSSKNSFMDYTFTKKKIKDKLPDIMQRDQLIFIQVTALVLMFYGMKIPDDYKTKIINSIQASMKDAQNFNQGMDREMCLNRLRNMVDKYEAPTRWKLEDGEYLQVIPNSVRFIQKD